MRRKALARLESLCESPDASVPSLAAEQGCFTNGLETVAVARVALALLLL